MIKEKLIIVITGKLRIKITCYLQLKCLGSLIIYYSTFVYFFLAIKSFSNKTSKHRLGTFSIKNYFTRFINASSNYNQGNFFIKGDFIKYF